MLNRIKQYIHTLHILVIILLLPLVVLLLINDLSKGIYKTLLFPSYGHIYVARVLEIKPFHAFKQVYIPIVAIFVFIFKNVFGDYIIAMSFLHFIYKYIYIVIYGWILCKLLKENKESVLWYMGAIMILNVVFLQTLKLLISNFSVLYFVPHSLMLILTMYMVYSLGIDININDYRKLANVLVMILITDSLYLFIYYKLYKCSIILPILLIIVIIIIYAKYGRNFIHKYRSVISVVCFIMIIHPVEGLFILVVAWMGFYLTYIVFKILQKTYYLIVILTLLLAVNMSIIYSDVNINLINYILSTIPSLYDISHLFSNRHLIVVALRTQYNLLLILLTLSTLLSMVTKTISKNKIFNIILFENLFLLFIITNQADFIVRYLHHIVIVIIISFIITIIENIEHVDIFINYNDRKAKVLTVASFFVVLCILLYVYSLFDVYNILNETYGKFSTITNELGELSQAEIHMVRVVNSILFKLLGPPVYISENIETKYGEYQPIIAYDNVIVVSDPYTALLLQKLLLLRTYFIPIFVIPDEYSNETLKTMFLVKDIIKDIIAGNITCLENIGSYKYYLLVLSERTAYYITNDKCLFVFLPVGSPFKFYKFNCVMKKKYEINVTKMILSIQNSNEYDIVYTAKLFKNDFYVYVILIKRR